MPESATGSGTGSVHNFMTCNCGQVDGHTKDCSIHKSWIGSKARKQDKRNVELFCPWCGKRWVVRRSKPREEPIPRFCSKECEDLRDNYWYERNNYEQSTQLTYGACLCEPSCCQRVRDHLGGLETEWAKIKKPVHEEFIDI